MVDERLAIVALFVTLKFVNDTLVNEKVEALKLEALIVVADKVVPVNVVIDAFVTEAFEAFTQLVAMEVDDTWVVVTKLQLTPCDTVKAEALNVANDPKGACIVPPFEVILFAVTIADALICPVQFTIDC